MGHTEAVAILVETPPRTMAVRATRGVANQGAGASTDYAARDGAAGTPARNCRSNQRARARADGAAGEGPRLWRRLASGYGHSAGCG